MKSHIKQSVTKEPSKDTSKFPVIKIAYMKRLGDATVCEPYGIHGNPPVESPCLMLTVNGDEANRYVIPLSALTRTKNLKEGEFETGNFKVGSIITFDEDGNIKVVSKKDVTVEAVSGKVTINSPDIVLNGRVEVKKNIKVKDEDVEGSELNGIVNNLGTISGVGNVQSQGKDLATHVHTGVEAGSDLSGPPA